MVEAVDSTADAQENGAAAPELNEGADGIDQSAMADRKNFYIKRLDIFAKTAHDSLAELKNEDFSNLIDELILLLKSLGKIMKIAFAGK